MAAGLALPPALRPPPSFGALTTPWWAVLGLALCVAGLLAGRHAPTVGGWARGVLRGEQPGLQAALLRGPAPVYYSRRPMSPSGGPPLVLHSGRHEHPDRSPARGLPRRGVSSTAALAAAAAVAVGCLVVWATVARRLPRPQPPASGTPPVPVRWTAAGASGSAPKRMALFPEGSLIHPDGSPAELTADPVGLYFSAAWCPDCQHADPLVSEAYKRQAEAGAKEALPVVLVSSDMSPEEFKRHVAALPPQWLAVRYEHPLRNQLKVQYGVCAMKEAGPLGVAERKRGIPTLLLVGQDAAALDYDGLKRFIPK